MKRDIGLVILVTVEFLFCLFIIQKVAYTNIDFSTYMQQVQLFLEGQFDYSEIKGDTGPLVYPAGFLYIYSIMYYATQQGQNVYLAQLIFTALSSLNLLIVYLIYKKSSLNPLIVFLCLASKRIHSIYVLRLFNDPFAMFFMYLTIYCMMLRKWSLAAITFSLSLSIKMNILLFAPGFAVIYYQATGLYKSIQYAMMAVSVQVILGLPFLMVSTENYLSKAFEFSRAFLYKWTVNWRMIPLNVFEMPAFSYILLSLHLAFLLIFLFKWTRPNGGIWKVFRTGLRGQSAITNDQIIYSLFTSNFIGIVFARSLHYQFYSWYFHTIPFLLWKTSFPILAKLLLFFAIEYCWNVYPSTITSSTILLSSHLLILFGLVISKEDARVKIS
ncbi:Dolichyl-P-Man:Man(5)GlcNAc(2)-PP-dolichyl mannosyltransferase, family GT58 [Globomyces pollinis-pini]|nr:Dolichyl-P-Man:Man(5)GlcNAc(2)-PP-dolichyl mannosyltransferase, family GT58 [Globomyces pollinis-pini]